MRVLDFHLTMLFPNQITFLLNPLHPQPDSAALNPLRSNEMLQMVNTISAQQGQISLSTGYRVHPFDAAEYWKAARIEPEAARKGCARSASAQGGAVGEPRAA